MEKRTKISLVVKAFLTNPNYTFKQLSELPEIKASNISIKSIQKYLNDPIIINLFGRETYNAIQRLLNSNKFQSNNTVEENDIPIERKFTNSVKKFENQKTLKKMKQIYELTRIHLNNPNMSFDEIADLYNKANVNEEQIDAQYVCVCLTSKEYSNFFADNLWNYIIDTQNQPSKKEEQSRLN